MDRLLEPELMENDEQAKAYAEGDFEIPHSQFIERLKAFINKPDFSGVALDLGCGPGDISRRFAIAYPESQIHAIDGSSAMIICGELMLTPVLQKRIRLILGRLPDAVLPKSAYEIIFSNSLLHHLHDPSILWQAIKKYSACGARIAVMDLLRPDNPASARMMVETYAGNEPEILQRDFYNSLLAAFSIEEINQQLENAGLDFSIHQISDRHVFISGVMP